jgi:glycosyltransferase involved in cell wall biosynthesis
MPTRDDTQGLRVLHVLSGIDRRVGGPVSALIGLAEAQAAMGMSVSVLATYKAGADLSAAEYLTAKGVATHIIGPCGRVLDRHSRIAGAAEDLAGVSEVVHIHALWEDVQHRAARAAQRRGIPYVIRPCGMLDPWSFNQRSRLKKRMYLMWRLRRNIERAAALHFTTPMERDVTQRWRFSTPTIVEPNGVDLAEFAELPPPGTFRQLYPQVGSRRLVVFLGRLHKGKGVELLLPAFALAAVPDTVLVIVGPDSEGSRAIWEGAARDLGIADRVIFTGMLRGAERVAALADADLFALPSFHENFGIAVVEALAAGTPVIVSDAVYLHPEIVQAQVGAVVPLRAPEIAAELRRWLVDPALRLAAARRARAFVWERYGWPRIAGRWAAHYRGMLGTTPSAG